MSALAEKRALSGVVDSQARGKALRARRLRLGIKSIRQLAMQSGVSREAVTAAEDGSASEDTYARLEAWFERFEEETGAAEKPADTSPGPRMVTFRLKGGDVDVVVEGPIEDIDALAATVERLLASSERKRAVESDESGDQPEE